MLEKTESIINATNEWLGRIVSWLIIAMVVITFFNVVMRYGFNFGLIAIQESVVYFHSIVFMLAIAYTYKHNGHVRVDIFYSKFSPTKKAWTDLLGTTFLLLPILYLSDLGKFRICIQFMDVVRGLQGSRRLTTCVYIKVFNPAYAAIIIFSRHRNYLS